LKLRYLIKFVDNMDKSVEFYRDLLGLTLKYHTPFWSEFATGETLLALHPASASNPAGTTQLGFAVPDIHAFYAEMLTKGIKFTQPPTQENGSALARFIDIDGKECSVSQAS